MSVLKMMDWLLIILIGIEVLLWSWRLWRDPIRLHPGTIMYRVVLSRLLHWPPWKERKTRLTNKEVKNYAKRSMLISFLMILGGLLGLVVDILQ